LHWLPSNPGAAFRSESQTRFQEEEEEEEEEEEDYNKKKSIVPNSRALRASKALTKVGTILLLFENV
jgi:hypothetical protein